MVEGFLRNRDEFVQVDWVHLVVYATTIPQSDEKLHDPCNS
jgi:hypothetical protein